MKSNELRIGNLMQDRKGRLCEVLRLSKDPDEVRISAIEGAITSMPIEPLPLTEEWLLKFGFKRTETDTGGNYSYYNGVIYLHSDFSLSLFNGHSDENDTPYFSPELKYIHQLQNLYFALTGEELV